MFFKAKFFIFFVLFFSFSGFVNAECGSLCSLEERDAVYSFLNEIWNFFSEYSDQKFSGLVSDDFVPDKTLFLKEARDTFLNYKPVEFVFTINEMSCGCGGGSIAVSVSWHRKLVARSTGAVIADSGESELVISNANDKMMLLQLRGDRIFKY